MGTGVAVAERGARPDRSERHDGGIAYQPALDGVRALAVASVLLFHGGVAGFGGGYLGVSVFFTLSGFLITTLLTAEVQRNDRVALGRFYARRARRLLPASVLVVVLVSIAAAVTDWFASVEELRAQAVGSLLQIANWVFLAGEGSYQDLLADSAGTASPLEHYWSLAIEEQFYWLWPLAFIGLWRLGRSERGRLVAFAVPTVLAVVAAPFIATVWGPDAAYWATPARAAEILLGALAGLIVFGREVPRRAAILAPTALLALGVAVIVFPSSGGPAYAGALPAVAVVSVGLLVGLQVESRTQRWCSASPLVWLGRVSYGVYLFHWPIYVVLNEQRTGIDGPLLLALRLTTTLAVAQLSYRWFEQPIRRGVRLPPRATLSVATFGTAVAVTVAFTVVPGPAGSYWSVSDSAADASSIVVVDEEPLTLAAPAGGDVDLDRGVNDEPVTPAAPASADADLDLRVDAPVVTAPSAANTRREHAELVDPVSPSGAAGSAEADHTTQPAASVDADEAPPTMIEDEADEGPGSTPPVVPEPSRPVRVVVAGDSTAEAIGGGMIQWAAARPSFAQVEVRALAGCGLVRGGELLIGERWVPQDAGCERFFYEALVDTAADLAVDVVVLATSSWDLVDRRWPDDAPQGGGSNHIAESADRVRSDFEDITRRLVEAGVGTVVWLEMPMSDVRWEPQIGPQEEPERHAVLHDAMAATADAFPGAAHVLDFDGWFTAAGLDADREVRPDGIHVTPAASLAIVEDYLAPHVLRTALDAG